MSKTLAAMLSLVAAGCGGEPSSEGSGSVDQLIFWMTDGVNQPATGAIPGDSSEDRWAFRGSSEIIDAAERCVPSFSVNRDWTHTTYVIVNSEQIDEDEREVFSCVKRRMSGEFSAGLGSIAELPDIDETDFEQLHALPR